MFPIIRNLFLFYIVQMPDNKPLKSIWIRFDILEVLGIEPMTLVIYGLYWTLNQLSYQCSLLSETFFLLYIALMQDQK